MKKAIFLIVVSFLCALAGCGEGSFTVTGEIKSALTAAPINETVSLCVDGSALSITGGSFVLRNLAAGPHTFSLETPGFIRFETTINLTANRNLVIPLISSGAPALDVSWENNYNDANEEAIGIVTRGNYVYVSTDALKILRYTPSGTFVDVFASTPETINHMKFDSSGNLWGIDKTGDVHQFSAGGSLVQSYDGLAAQPTIIWGLAVDDSHIYVFDPSIDKVKKYRRSDGAKVAELGEADGQAFNDVCQLALGPDGCLYVTDYHNARIVALSTSLAVNRTFTIQLSGEATPQPMALTFGPDGCLYVHDRANNCIKKLSPDDDVILSIPTVTTTISMWVNGLAMDDSGNLFVADNKESFGMIRRFHWNRSQTK